MCASTSRSTGRLFVEHGTAGWAPAEKLTPRVCPQPVSSPSLPEKMRKVSPIQASAMLQSTNELNNIVSALVKTNDGVDSFDLVSSLLQPVKTAHAIVA